MYEFKFDAELSKYDYGKYYYTIVWLPTNLHKALPLKEHPRLRVEAYIEGVIIDGAFNPKQNRWYLILNKKILKRIDKQLGDIVTVEFSVVDQNLVYIPDSLKKLMDDDINFKQKWDELTPGKQRGYAYMIAKAKSPRIIEKRLFEVHDEVMNQ